jgi:hypothetical protein
MFQPSMSIELVAILADANLHDRETTLSSKQHLGGNGPRKAMGFWNAATGDRHQPHDFPRGQTLSPLWPRDTHQNRRTATAKGVEWHHP